MKSEDPITKKKNRGLGRGLDALFEDGEEEFAPQAPAAHAETPSGDGSGRRMLGTDQLEPGPFQPRTLFDEAHLIELSDSLKLHGMLQPILVRPLEGRPEYFEIVAGERRWRAAQKAGMHEVPVIIRTLSDKDAMEIALIENLHREDLNPVDEATGYRKLMDDHGHTQEEVAKAVGKSRPHIANLVRLLALPDTVLGLLERGDLSAGHARALLQLENPETLAREIVKEGLSVREAEHRAARERPLAAKAKGKDKSRPKKDADTREIEADLSNELGMRVTLNHQGEKGRMTIDYTSLDHLTQLIGIIRRGNA